MNILLVDDNPDYRFLMNLALTMGGYTTYSAEDGMEARGRRTRRAPPQRGAARRAAPGAPRRAAAGSRDVACVVPSVQDAVARLSRADRPL